MAEITAMRNNALPYPMYGLAWTIVFPLLDADGDLVSAATTPDSERSLNGDTFADCTNEMTEIATNSGIYYLTLTAAEMTADIVTVQAKSATAGMKTTVATLYPRKLVAFKASATVSAGAAGTITFDAGTRSAIDDFYNGMIVVAVLDGLTEARVITDYVGSTGVASVSPNWNTTPDSDDTFIVYLPPEHPFMSVANVTMWNSAAIASPHTAGYPAVTIKDGTGTGEIDTTSGGVLVAALAANAITATAINADAFTAAKFAADVTTELQSGLATAAALDTIDNFLDTEVQAIKDKTDLIPNTVDGKTLTEALVIILSALAGKASGLGTTTAVFRSIDDTVDRITATVDADGNRSAVTLDVSSP